MFENDNKTKMTPKTHFITKKELNKENHFGNGKMRLLALQLSN